MDKFNQTFWRIILLVALLFFSSPAYSQLRKVGLLTLNVELSGPKNLAGGEIATYTINFQVKRIKEKGVDPAKEDITTGLSLMDDDGWFRFGDDLLSHKYVTVPRGEHGTVYSGTETLQLKCTPEKRRIRGVGSVPYGDGKSGEGTAEVYAEFNGKKSKVMDVNCKQK